VVFHAILQAIEEEVRQASLGLVMARQPRAETVHAARKALKNARGGVGLLRYGLGESAHDGANRAMRDAARLFAGIRDDEVLIRTLEDIRERVNDPAARRALDALMLRSRRDSKSRQIEFQATRLQRQNHARAMLIWCDQVGQCSQEGSDQALVRGLRRSYAKARGAFRTARALPATEALHELRKSSRRLAASLEMIRSVSHRRSPSDLQKRLEALVECLGVDHDLALLAERAEQIGQLGEGGQSLGAWLARRRRNLQQRAMKLARKAFFAPAGEKIKSFEETVARAARASSARIAKSPIQ
jgi:CHAD domain-containing protein